MNGNTVGRRLGVAALVALALPLAGCGGDELAGPDGPLAPTGTAAGQPTGGADAPAGGEATGDEVTGDEATGEPTPTVDPALLRWTDEVCGVVAEHTPDVSPPQIDPEDPLGTAQAFGAMFGTMEELMRKQRAGVDAVGEPPVEKVRPPYTQALRRFERARVLLVQAEQRLSGVSPENPQQLVEALRSVGDMQVGGKAYPGLVVDLSGLDTSFRDAVHQAPACDDVPGV